jgi:hypothetical protein
MDIQNYLLLATQEEVKRLNSAKIRAVTACWKGNIACLSFYFNGEITEEDLESASDICTYIISHFPNGLLEENYIRLDYPKPIPKNFLAYDKERLK